MLEEGTQFPDFDTIDDRGQRIRRDLLGKWAVVWWYLKADTPAERSKGRGSVTEP